MRVSFSLLLLIGAVSSSFIFWERPPTRFHANGTLYCRLNTPWCYRVSMYETDYPFPDDKIDIYGTRCTREARVPYELSGIQTGDGLWNFEYEVSIYVSHNCTRSGKKRLLERRTQNFKVDTKRVHMTFNVNVADVGKFVENYA